MKYTEYNLPEREIQKIGANLAAGFIKTLGIYVILGIAAVSLYVVFMNAFSIGTDNSDENGWSRSGLKIHRDHKTGIEYLSTKDGALICRGE